MVDIALTKPQRLFVFSEAAHPAIVGGLRLRKNSSRNNAFNTQGFGR